MSRRNPSAAAPAVALALLVILAGCTSGGAGAGASNARAANGSEVPSAAPSPASAGERPASATAFEAPRRARRTPAPRAKPEEVRASWVVRTSIASDDAAAAVAADAKRSGLNTLMVQVRGRGDAWYRSQLEPPPDRKSAPGFDPLDAAIEHGLAEGLWIHAWVNAVLAGPPDGHPDPRHLVNAHPEWLILPDALAPELLALPPGDPAFRAKLSAWLRANEGRAEGFYADPANPEFRAHLVAVCEEIASGYPVDGIHLDYIRYPGKEWGASRVALAAFRREIDSGIDAKERQANAAKLAADPLAYPKRYPSRWIAFKRASVDRLVREASGAVRRARPGIAVTAAVFGDQKEAREVVCQDWPRWLAEGWIDVACPMIYAKARKTFQAQLDAAVKTAKRGRIWAGIGSWQIDDAEVLQRVKLARAAHADGMVLFSHGDLQKRDALIASLRTTEFR